MSYRIRRKYKPDTCQDCGNYRNVTTVYWWVSNTPYRVCAECIMPYRGLILAPCTSLCVHDIHRAERGQGVLV